MNHHELESRFAAQQEFLDTDKPVNAVQPMVSVVVATYQHAGYIAQCLDGILMQKSSFPVEVIVGEDESPDGTREICIEYAKNYPDRIRLFLRSRSLSTYVENGVTRRLNGAWCRRSARGRYIAMCEGDDYWTSEDKLQKQVDFLEAHPEFSMCFHNVLVIDEVGREAPRLAYRREMQPSYGVMDILPQNFIHTPSVVYRKNALPQSMPEWFRLMPMSDWPTYLLLAQTGRFGYLQDVMCVYRMHAGGIWSQLPRPQFLEKQTLAAETVLNEHFAKLPDAAHEMATLRRDLVGMYAEQGNYSAAAMHARKLLRYTSRRYLGELRRASSRYFSVMRWLLITIVRASWPYILNVARRDRAGPMDRDGSKDRARGGKHEPGRPRPG